jgi:pimeloyl-ACP methyl ester carboxylesterase
VPSVYALRVHHVIGRDSRVSSPTRGLFPPPIRGISSTLAGPVTPLDQTIRLSDGRELAYAEYGPAGGVPLFLFHGLPGSRLAGPEMWLDDPGPVRVIAPDRPGFGRSTFQPGRRFPDWAEDVRELADSLEIDRFLVVGFSSGGAHALAVAHGLPHRVIAVGTIGGSAPTHTAPATRAGVWLRAAPAVFVTKHRPAMLIDRALRSATVPAADKAAFSDPRLRELKIAAAPEAFRNGARGYVQEGRLYGQPWGFELAAVEPPVFIWHGELDASVPVAMAHYLADRLPDNTVKIYSNEGHLIVPEHWPEIVATLLERVNADR